MGTGDFQLVYAILKDRRYVYRLILVVSSFLDWLDEMETDSITLPYF
jgi:hypothetical protein